MSASHRDDGGPKLDALRARLRELGSVLVCYSGGVDSAFVMAVAHEVLGPRAIAMTAVSPSLLPLELEEASAVARALGADHRLVDSQEIEDEGYRRNHTDRCFYCKSELYRLAEDRRRAWDLAYVLNGTNVDDLGDHRPGLEAAAQAGVVSPLVELGFTKADVRAGAQAIRLGTWNKPAAACLSSRIPFGTEVTRERLARIGALETALRGLGFRQVRVRYHVIPASEGTVEGAIARVEVGEGELAKTMDPVVREEIVRVGRVAGFTFVTVDLAGYRMGSHNAVLAGGARSLPVLR